MNSITRKMWANKTTLRDWSRKHGFNPRYVQAIISPNNKRGAWSIGIGLEIKEALIKDGYMTRSEAGLTR